MSAASWSTMEGLLIGLLLGSGGVAVSLWSVQDPVTERVATRTQTVLREVVGVRASTARGEVKGPKRRSFKPLVPHAEQKVRPSPAASSDRSRPNPVVASTKKSKQTGARPLFHRPRTKPLSPGSQGGSKPLRVWTDRRVVTAMQRDADSLWVGTRGGVERYRLPEKGNTPSLLRVYTTLDGLPTNNVVHLALLDDELVVRTDASECILRKERFHCRDAPSLGLAAEVVGPVYRGARQTARVAYGTGVFIGTAGGGVWWEQGRRATSLLAADMVCGNHIMAMQEHKGSLYLGSFDQGLCVWKQGRVHAIETPFRMVNAMLSTSKGLFVATGLGLYVIDEQGRVRRAAQIAERGTNGLAIDGKNVLVTTPGALHRFRLGRSTRARSWWMPAGSRSLQKVRAYGGQVWMASEDRGAIQVLKEGRGYRFRAFDAMAGLPSSWALDVAVGPAGTVYVATLRDGLVAMRPGKAARKVDRPLDDWMLRLASVERGLWVGTQEGAGLLHPDGRYQPLSSLPDPRVHAVVEFEGRLFVATEGGLLERPASLEPQKDASVAVAPFQQASSS